MTIEVRVPQLPESVADATLVSWHKKPGDAVARDENLVDLETDKVVLEVPAPAAGVLKEIKLADGTKVTSGQILALIEDGASAAAVPAGTARRPRLLLAPHSRRSRPAAATAAKLSPAAKRVAEENKVDPKAVTGSGPRRQGLEVRRRQLSADEGCARRLRRPGHRPPAGQRRPGTAAPPATAKRARSPGGSARAHDAPARAHRRTHGAGASDAGFIDLLQ